MSTRRAVHLCASENNLPALRAAIAAGHSVDECGSFKETPLMAAAYMNNVEIVRVLLDAGASLENRSSFGGTALDSACDHSSNEAALLLISRGASGDTQGPTGRTTLQTAVKRGMVEVVRALLEAGQGDPTVKSSSNHDALHYVQAKKPHAAELRRLLSEFMSLDNAIAANNVKAIHVLMRRVMATDDLAASVAAYLQAAKTTPLEAFRVQLLLATIAAKNVALFEQLLLADNDAPTGHDRLDALNKLRFEAHSGTSALHIAAFYGHAEFVEYLLVECGMDPCVEDALKRRPVQLVDDRKDPSGTVRALLVQVMRLRQVSIFTNRLLTCKGTLSQLEELAQSLSSVYDIRAVFSLSSSTLAKRPDEMKRVLTQAFTRLINEKLVFNDREALFSKMALRECLRRGFFTEAEFEYWNMQVVKVNMESAAWVSALKQSVLRLDARVAVVEQRTAALQHEFKNFRDAVQNQDEQASSLGQSLSMFTSLLGVAEGDSEGGGGLGDVFANVLDLSSPQDVLAAVLNAAGAGDVASFVNDPSSSLLELAMPSELQEQFEAVGVDPVEFVGLLKDAIVGEEEAAGDEPVEDLSVDEVVDTALEVGESLADLGLEDDENDENAQAKQDEQEEEDDVGDDELVECPFHFAVKHSGGDISVFRDVVAYIEPQDGDVNDLAMVSIPSADSTDKEEEELELSPVVYASCLGYVEIVRYLLTRPDIVPTEKKFVTMQRAQQRAATAAGA